MNFELRGIGGKITDVMRRAKSPKWSWRGFGGGAKPIETLEAEALRASDIEAMLDSPGWQAFRAYAQQRQQSCQHMLESAVLTQEKALELATIQGRLKELRSIEEWAEAERKRGRETTQELAERKRPK